MAAKKITPIDAARETRRHRINESYSKLHPDRAREERRLRKDNLTLQARWGHKRHGTPETHEKASRVRQGSLARLYEAGQITIAELVWSQDIREIHARLAADLGIRTVSLETRVDRSQHGGAFFEALGSVRREIAYSAWRATLPHPAVVLAMICDDCPISVAARHWRMRTARAKALLLDALDRWPNHFREACKKVDPADLLAAQAGLI